MNDFLWHLFNDPMRENPWSVLFLVALAAGFFAAVWFNPLQRRRRYGCAGSVERLGALIRRTVERSVRRLPYWPDPKATCSAHGDRYCLHCHRHPSSCESPDGPCGMWFSTGMHWDTCMNRIRGPL